MKTQTANIKMGKTSAETWMNPEMVKQSDVSETDKHPPRSLIQGSKMWHKWADFGNKGDPQAAKQTYGYQRSAGERRMN